MKGWKRSKAMLKKNPWRFNFMHLKLILQCMKVCVLLKEEEKDRRKGERTPSETYQSWTANPFERMLAISVCFWSSILQVACRGGDRFLTFAAGSVEENEERTQKQRISTCFITFEGASWIQFFKENPIGATCFASWSIVHDHQK